MLVLVVYDISDDRRRNRLATFLEGYGRRVQESVFECFLSLEEMKRLHERVKRQVKPDDNVRFYWIPKEAVSRALTLGSLLPEPPPDVYIV